MVRWADWERVAYSCENIGDGTVTEAELAGALGLLEAVVTVRGGTEGQSTKRLRGAECTTARCRAQALSVAGNETRRAGVFDS